MLEIDGSTLEGGGQLVRNALVCSALTGTTLKISNIRKGRPKGGLKPSHSAAVTFMANLCGATFQGAETGSKELVFEPPARESGMVWKTQRKSFSIDLKSPGSIFLIFQAVYPYILFSSTASPNPISLTITGGTNVTFSPSYEYLAQVLLPTLSALGLPPLTASLHRRGWTTGRTQLGSVTFDIHPLAVGTCLPAFSLTDRGPITKVSISLLASGDETRGLLRSESVARVTAAFDVDVEVTMAVDENSGSEKRLYLLLVAESGNGFRLGRDWLYDQKIGDPKKAVCKLVKQVVKDLVEEVESGACVDEHMRDQVVLFQSLAQGRSAVNGGCVKRDEEHEEDDDTGESVAREPTLHTRTAEWVAKQVLGVKFDSGGSCEGVAFIAGQTFGMEDQEGEKPALVDRLLKVDLEAKGTHEARGLDWSN